MRSDLFVLLIIRRTFEVLENCGARGEPKFRARYGGFAASPELGPIDPRRGGIIWAVVCLGKPTELLRGLEEPPLTAE